MTGLYLIRHGRTDWNDSKRFQGHADPPLNDQGRQQGREIAQALQAVPFVAAYSSDLRRARQTAQALVNLTGLPLRFDQRLREIALGEWEGLTLTEIQARYPTLWEQWTHVPSTVRLPGGETLAQVEKRLTAALDDVAALHRGTVAVFTHGIPVAIVRCRVQGLPLDRYWDVVPENGAWEIVQWPPAAPGGPLCQDPLL